MTTKNSAKKLTNIARSVERLKLLQARQRLAKSLRELGFAGRTDNEVIDRFNAVEKADSAQSYVDKVLVVPVTGNVIKRWLKNRILQNPIFVKGLIEKFLARDGSDGGKDNAEHRDNVAEALQATEYKQAA
jgi:hypothetical protein